MQKRPNAVTFKGKAYTLVGPQLKVGDQAPDFACVSSSLEVVGIKQTPAKPRLFSVVPSLDTPVCSMQTKKFEESLAGMKDKISTYTISLDLPFAQKRFCAAEGVAKSSCEDAFLPTCTTTPSAKTTECPPSKDWPCRCLCCREPSSSSMVTAKSPTSNT